MAFQGYDVTEHALIATCAPRQSDMKHDAIVESGIPIHKRYDIPAELLPPDSQVEIDAKIAAGYFSASKQVRMEDLHLTVGRAWEDLEH